MQMKLYIITLIIIRSQVPHGTSMRH